MPWIDDEEAVLGMAGVDQKDCSGRERRQTEPLEAAGLPGKFGERLRNELGIRHDSRVSLQEDGQARLGQNPSVFGPVRFVSLPVSRIISGHLRGFSQAFYRSNPSMIQTSGLRFSRITRVTVVVRFAPTLGVSVCMTRQLTRAVVPSREMIRTISMVTSSPRMSLNALARLSAGIDGWTFLTALTSRLSSAAV